MTTSLAIADQNLTTLRIINNTAAEQFAAAIRSAQVLPEFRRAGLQPSV